MLRTTATALLLVAGLLAFAPAASASHSRCHNEPGQDIYLPDLGVPVDAGVDGPLFDHNGVQVCVGETAVSVETTTDPLGTDGPIPPPPGSGVAARVCAADGTGQDECEGVILLDWTGVTVACTTPNSVCVWVDGQRVVG